LHIFKRLPGSVEKVLCTIQEFQVMYHRCRNDIAGTEPRRLFNVAEFVMNDKQGLGTVSMENAMQIMYLRYGRNDLDAQLQDIFGTSDLNSGKTLTLTEFLSSLHASQVKQLRNRVTAKTYVAPGAGKKAVQA
jgi:calmodulin